MKQIVGIGLLTLLAIGAVASADQIIGELSADDSFVAYISTSDSTAGTQIGAGSDWASPLSLNPVTLTLGQTYYLHIAATNASGAAGFIGNLNLLFTPLPVGPQFQFANGLLNLHTETTDWRVSDSGFGSGYYTPTDEGSDGVSPWGLINGFGSAHWLWGSTAQDNQTEYFSTKISPSATAAPLPAALCEGALLLAGLAGWRLRAKYRE